MSEQVELAVNAIKEKMKTSEIVDIQLAIMQDQEELLEAMNNIVTERLMELSKM